MDCSSGESKYHDELSCRTLRTSLTAKGNILSISVHELHHLASLSLSDIAMYVCLQLGIGELCLNHFHQLQTYRNETEQKTQQREQFNKQHDILSCAGFYLSTPHLQNHFAHSRHVEEPYNKFTINFIYKGIPCLMISFLLVTLIHCIKPTGHLLNSPAFMPYFNKTIR